MGRRQRQRTRSAGPGAGAPARPTGEYRDQEAGVLELRCVLGAAARLEYARTLAGGLNREDARQRAIELLFERLAVSWTIHGLRTDRPRELLGRYRMASQAERQFVLEALREHLAEHFPEMEAP
ncbi:MAG TPA: hypothetical protein VKV27_09070 [Solirubrobacteraceae bacterium]|nr:hypothetical protein [Solirubrobacteraceae bacterium]